MSSDRSSHARGSAHGADRETASCWRSLGAAIAAALISGLLVGALDALLAWRDFRALGDGVVEELRPSGALQLLWGMAGSVLVHTGLAAVLLLPAALILRFIARDVRRLESWLIALGLGLATFAILFWHTREVIYPGVPATDPRRLAVAAGMLALTLLLGAILSRLINGAATRRTLEVASGLAVAAGALHIAMSGQAVASAGALNERNREMPNVVLVIVDALRPDVLGPYGNSGVQTPNIDGIAERGVVFETALAQAPFTGASFGSFFTGKYPRRHGLLTMAPGVRIEPGDTFVQTLKSGRLLEGGQLESGDVVAASFMTGALSHGSGLMEGFDAYRELMMGHPLVELSNRWSVFRSKLVPFRVWSKLEGKLDDDLLVHDARDWIAEHADRRFALFVHLYSTHTPYAPPAEFSDLYIDPDYDGPITRFDSSHRRAIEKADYVPDAADVRRIYDLYRGGVTQADHQIGILLDELERAGILDDTLFIVSSDHGEDIGTGAAFDPDTGEAMRRGRWEHNHMYRSNLAIPLLMQWPGRLPAGVRVSEHVESVDVAPTIAELAGIESVEAVEPRDQVDGRSLIAAVEAAAAEIPYDHKTYTFAEDATYVSISDERYMLTLERFAVQPDGWRIALEEGLGRVRFHDLVEHPQGERDLFRDIVRAPEGEVAEATRARVLAEIDRLRAALLDWNATMPIDVETVERSDRDRETDANDAAYLATLDELGYIEGWDDYGGELRQRVLAERSAAQREPGTDDRGPVRSP